MSFIRDFFIILEMEEICLEFGYMFKLLNGRVGYCSIVVFLLLEGCLEGIFKFSSLVSFVVLR